MASAEEEFDVTVLSRVDITTFPKVATPVIVRQVSYVTMGLPPATVKILKSVWTPEFERRVIREDVERRLKQRPETIRV